MQIRRRFRLLICAGLFTTAALSGCGSSSTTETVPNTVSIFNSHSVIFRNNSTMTMGYNEFGQLGDGTLDNRAVATLVPGLGHMTKGSVGAVHTLVFSNQGSVVMAWGYNGYGQIGNTNVSTSSGIAFTNDPVPVRFDALVSDVAAGGFHSLAVAGGAVRGWGYNGNGQVGDGTSTNQNAPVKLEKDIENATLPATAVQVAAGGLHSLALFDEGATASVYAWGNNSHGQIGFSPYSSPVNYSRPKKVRLTEVTGKVEQIAAGGKFSLALEVVRDGLGNITGQTLWGWGFGGAGQLGADPKTLDMLVATNSETAFSQSPRILYTVTGVGAGTTVIKKFAAGLDHVLLLLGVRDSDGSDGSWTVQALGYNFFGQLGNDMKPSLTSKDTSSSSFELVHTLDVSGTADLTGATDIAAFGNHSLALVNGKWYGWGNNNTGQLGNPAPVSSAGNPKIPVLVQGF